jgi:hypothetical protein
MGNIIKLLIIQRKIKGLTKKIKKLEDKSEKAFERRDYQASKMFDDMIRTTKLDLEDVYKEARKCVKQ